MIDVHVYSKNSAKSGLCRLKTLAAKQKCAEIEM